MREIVLIDPEKTGENIHKIAKRSGMSARDLADVCGFSQTASVYAWYGGKNIPSIDNLVLLSDAFGVPIDDIIVRRCL